MSTSLPPVAHAIQRAKERYGIELSMAELRAIALRCKAGEGRTQPRQDGKFLHIIVHGERVLWAVYKPPSPLDPDGLVVTIMPPEVAAKVSNVDARHIERRQGHRRLRKAWR